MGKVTALLYERFKAGKLPLTVQSMDNCSHNGDKVKAAVFAYASKWVEQGLVPAEFLAYVKDETKITFPWSMIDKPMASTSPIQSCPAGLSAGPPPALLHTTSACLLYTSRCV